MTIFIENIRPSFDEETGQDILRFRLGNDEKFEFLEGATLGISKMGRDSSGVYGLYNHFNLEEEFEDDEEQMDEIHAWLRTWISENRGWRSSYQSEHSDVASIEHGINRSHGRIEVMLTDDAAKRLNVKDGNYTITRDGSISWTDIDHGDQYVENNPGGTQEVITRNRFLANPEEAIYEIEYAVRNQILPSAA